MDAEEYRRQLERRLQRRAQQFLPRLKRRHERSKEDLVRHYQELRESPEQRRLRREVEEESRLRQVWAELGVTPEEAEKRQEEFRRKFQSGNS